MSDKINNWYDKIDKKFIKKHALDKNYKEHFINPTSHVLCLGGTSAGKTNALMEFIKRKEGAFYEIIIFTGSTSDEPIYNFLKAKIPDIQIYTDINELPSLNDFPDDTNDQEKLIVFDDFTDLKPKEMSKIKEYLKAGRKKGFSCWNLAQNYVSVNKNISRNCQYFIIFKLNDSVSLNNIIRNHNVDNIDKECILNAYQIATKQPVNFLMIDTTVGAGIKSLRHNFKSFFHK